MSHERPVFPSQTVAIVAGVVLFFAGSFCLHDAWEGRGMKPPWALRVVSWW